MKKNKKAKINKKLSGARKLALGLFLLFIVSALILVGINTYIKSSVKNRILTLDGLSSLEADCIVVLGAGVRDDGTPSHMLEDRLLRAIEVYETGVSEKLLMSGDHGTDGYDEVNTMKAFAIQRGVAAENIFMDHAGFSTYESIYRAKEIFKVDKAIIITQGYHLYRALYIADRLGIEAYGVSSDLRTYRGQEYFSFRESVARAKDFFTVIFKPEPTYLGESIPISGNGNITNDKEGSTK